MIVCSLTWFFAGCAGTPNKLLLEAVEKGDIDQTKRSLSMGADPDSALISAVKQKKLDVARLLLSRGADPNLGDAYLLEGLVAVDTKTNAQYAVTTKQMKDSMIGVYVLSDDPAVKSKARAILKENRFYFKYKLRKTGGKAPLHIAIDNNDEEMIKLLLKHGAIAAEPRFTGKVDLCPWYQSYPKEYVLATLSEGSPVRGQPQAQANNGRPGKGTRCIIEKDGDGFRAYQAPLQTTDRIGSAMEYAKTKGNAAAVKLFETSKKADDNGQKGL